ncbi:hypothetical protein FQN50_000005 [Emmonsiellopsis sp. PD_5]|nr:hypothetical protein FQN50_000005 [Emmonsiellopsis sp. PD_5]
MSTTAKRKRASAPRVRTGCSTCKIRHVKCDEEKPECRQCTSTGRKCDGYQPVNKQEHQKPQRQHLDRLRYSSSASPAPLLSADHRVVLRPGTRTERHYVELFCSRTAGAFSGYFQSGLWDYLLPQLSQSNAAVRHAVTAISAIHHEKYLRASGALQALPPVDISSEENEKFALHQYNKAIGSLLEYLSQPEQPLDLTIIVCCLFACLEMLRGNNGQAMDHMEAGLRILSRPAQDGTPFHQQGGNNRTVTSADIEKELSHLWSRFNIQLSLFGRQLAPFAPENDTTTKDPAGNGLTFTTVADARHSLDVLMDKALRFIRVAIHHPDPSTALFMQQQADIKTEFDSWSVAFDNLMKRPERRIKLSDPRGPLLLRTYHQTTATWLLTCCSKSTMIFDNYEADFAAIISYVDEMLRPSEGGSSEPFSLEMGAIPALYWSACKCRNPILRRKAIELLLGHSRHEGMWQAQKSVRVAQKALEVEEAAVSHLPVELRFVEEEHRIYDVLVPPDPTCDFVFLVRKDPDGGFFQTVQPLGST